MSGIYTVERSLYETECGSEWADVEADSPEEAARLVMSNEVELCECPGYDTKIYHTETADDPVELERVYEEETGRLWHPAGDDPATLAERAAAILKQSAEDEHLDVEEALHLIEEVAGLPRLVEVDKGGGA